MATFPSDARPSEDEVAAAIVAVRAYLVSERANDTEGAALNLWAAAGRLEAMGRRPDRSRIARGWRAEL